MILEKNNFYAFFETTQIAKIKEIFENAGWNSSKASWYGFELSNNWSELILEPYESEILLNGAVMFNPENVEALDLVFAKTGAGFKYEFYDDDHNLLLEKKSP